jgi:hypothetical protein
VAVRDEDVLPSVEVHVHEHGRPRPPARLNAGVERRLAERTVAAIDEEGVPLLLELRLDVSRPLGQRRVRGHLRLQAAGVVAEHVDLEEVGQAIAVHVGDVEPHRRVAHLALCRPAGEPEAPATVVEPELVRVLEVVRQIEVGRAVGVQVHEFCA